MSVPTSSQDQPHDENLSPLWTYVTKLKKVRGGGNWEIQCNICNTIFNGSYTRVKGQLCKKSGHGVRACANVSNARAMEFTNMDNEYNLKIEKLKSKPVSLHPVSSAPQDSTTTNIDPKKRKMSTLSAAFNLQARETLDHEIGRMFFSAGLPFNLSRNPHFRRAFSYAADNNISGYQPPGYNKLRTTLLQDERNHVENLLQPLKNAWNQKGVTIASDGWSDPQRRPLINFMAVTESGPMFLKAVDCSNEVKDREFIAKRMREVIMEVGPTNVVQIVTDNAHVCKAAGLIIEAEFPYIYWTPCVVHTLNLALKNICAPTNSEKNKDVYQECSWITQIEVDEGSQVVLGSTKSTRA